MTHLKYDLFTCAVNTHFMGQMVEFLIQMWTIQAPKILALEGTLKRSDVEKLG